MLNISKRLLQNIVNQHNSIALRRLARQLKNNQSINREQPIITCKRSEYNFYPSNKTHDKLEEIKLASKGWHHRKSNGDYIIFHTRDDFQTYDTSTSFADTGLTDELIRSVREQGIANPTVIQSKAIPVLLSGRNSLITAETGCGKTLAYLLPAIQQVLLQKNQNPSNAFNSPLCIILTPSRELAYQVEHVTSSLVRHLDVRTQVIVGGGTKKKMLNPTFQVVDVLIATLGALSKLVTTGIYKLGQVKHVVLDEADTLLDDSFSPKMSHLLSKLPLRYSNENTTEFCGCQVTLVSATILKNVPDSIADVLAPESLVRISTEHLHHMLPHVAQRFLRLGPSTKAAELLRMVKADAAKQRPTIVFSNSSPTCDWISLFLSENGVPCVNLNGAMSLQIREAQFQRFQRGDVHVISCTDVGSRGLDTTRVKHVINFDFPVYMADYIHRCGRTGRIGSPDHCHITNFISRGREVALVQKIEMSVRTAKIIPNVDGNISGIIRDRISQNN